MTSALRARTVFALVAAVVVAVTLASCSGDSEPDRTPVGKNLVGRTVQSVQVSDGITLDARDVAADLDVGRNGQPARTVDGDLSGWNIVVACPDIVDGKLMAGVVTGDEWERVVERDGVVKAMESPPTHLLKCP